jgi:hypothetical protein
MFFNGIKCFESNLSLKHKFRTETQKRSKTLEMRIVGVFSQVCLLC